MKKARNGEGRIWCEKPGLWYGQISLGKRPNGKRYRPKVRGTSRRDVQNQLADLRRKHDPRDSSLTVADLLDRWMDFHVKEKCRDNTEDYYRRGIDAIKPAIGSKSVAELTPLDIEAAYQSLKCPASVVASAHRALRAAFNRAIAWAIISNSPVAGINEPKQPKRKIDPFTAEEAKRIIKATDGRWKALFVLAIHTGMRQGELFGLHWDSIQRDTLVIERQLTETANKPLAIAPLKTEAVRDIAIAKPVQTALHDHRKLMLAEGHAADPMCFLTPSGTWLRKSNFRKNIWVPLQTLAKVRPRRFHDLRHTYATLALSANVSPKVVQTVLGHRDITTTLNIYGHVLPDQQADAAAEISRLLG